MSTNKKSVFETLSEINVNNKTEKKGRLTYLSWAWAWAEVKKAYPSATYEIVKHGEDKKLYSYEEGTGYFVETTVTIEGETLPMWLCVMDNRNNSILKNASSFDINKTLMRCLVKNLGMHGLGHYIYAGEDLPESESSNTAPTPKIPERKKLESGTETFKKALQGMTQKKGTPEGLLQKFQISKEDFNLLKNAYNG